MAFGNKNYHQRSGEDEVSFISIRRSNQIIVYHFFNTILIFLEWQSLCVRPLEKSLRVAENPYINLQQQRAPSLQVISPTRYKYLLNLLQPHSRISTPKRSTHPTPLSQMRGAILCQQHLKHSSSKRTAFLNRLIRRAPVVPEE